MPQRIQYLDLAKFFAIWLVIGGHYFLLFAEPSNRLHDVIYSFHMPLFMMLSGFFAGRALDGGFLDLVKGKAKRLLIPVVWCSLLEILIKWGLGEFDVAGNRELGIEGVRDIVIGNSWFLKTLFAVFIIVRMTKYMTKSNVVGMIVSCAIICLIPHSYSLQLNWMLPFFWIGMILKQILNSKSAETNNCGNGLKTWLLAALFMLCYFFLYSGNVLITWDSIVNEPLRLCGQFIVATVGSLMMICFSKWAYEKFSQSKVIEHWCKIGRYTLELYIVQTIIIDVLLRSVCHLDMAPRIQECLLLPVSLGLLYLCLRVVKCVVTVRG